MEDERREPTDSTAPMDRPDFDRPPHPGGSAGTAPMPRPAAGPDATRAMPAAPGEDRRWAARAAVPSAGPAPVHDHGYLDEPVPGGPEERSWLTPLVVGVVGLMLLGVLLAGLWLIGTADDEGTPAPSAIPPPAPTSAPPATRRATTAPPTTAPPSTVSDTVPVPPLVGLPEDEVRQRLTDAGLRVEVSRRADGSVPPGTVLDSSPDEGEEVEPNSVVRIVVATAPSPRTSTSTG